MKCPRCESVVLDEHDRSGLTLDRCPTCRGIWLDRGELEKLMAKELPVDPPPPPSAASAPFSYRRESYPPAGHYRDDDDDRYRKYPDHYRKRRWKDLLGDIFD